MPKQSLKFLTTGDCFAPLRSARNDIKVQFMPVQSIACLAELLNQELKQPKLSAQIPDGAHLFYGAYNDPAMTQDNLRLASKTLLGMTLSYVEDAPLFMVFESRDGNQMIIDLSDKTEKTKIRSFIEKFQKQRQREMVNKINELLPA